jgi:hypothetical protein
MNTLIKKNLYDHLKKRGRISTTTDETVEPPKRLFKTTSEEIINLLNISSTPLTIKEIANYLGINAKNTSKVMRNLLLYQGTNKYITKVKLGRSAQYSCNLPNDVDVPYTYKMIKHTVTLNAIKKQQNSDTRILSDADINEARHKITQEILELIKTGEYEFSISIRKIK